MTAAPSTLPRRLLRGFDLSAEAAQVLARRLERPWVPLLHKAWRSGRQATRTESQRRRLPRQAISPHPGVRPEGIVLLVDDVWTDGMTVLRCAQALEAGGASGVWVLTLLRAL